MRRHAVVALAALAIAAGGCSSSGGDIGDPIAEYCAYGAVSDAQRAGCEDHVEQSDIDELDTNAAKFSRGELNECLGDAGPFCEPR